MQNCLHWYPQVWLYNFSLSLSVDTILLLLKASWAKRMAGAQLSTANCCDLLCRNHQEKGTSLHPIFTSNRFIPKHLWELEEIVWGQPQHWKPETFSRLESQSIRSYLSSKDPQGRLPFNTFFAVVSSFHSCSVNLTFLFLKLLCDSKVFHILIKQC